MAREKGGRTPFGRFPPVFSRENGGTASAACCLFTFSKIHENAPKVMQLCNIACGAPEIKKKELNSKNRNIFLSRHFQETGKGLLYNKNDRF